MRKWLVLSALAVAGLFASPDRASAFGYGLVVRPYYTSATFPCLNPSGYYTNSYYYAWYYPWFANYNYSHGPYANWWQWGGYATYGGCCGPKGYAAAGVVAPVPVAGTVTVTLPAEARLLFNGTAAGGTGGVRTFATPPLLVDQEYAYELTAEVTLGGVTQKVTERVIIRAGQETKVLLAPGGK
ncbi:MAG: hypothetical protein JWO38_4167 [Gemmataceae bacterium]|nr:hypothetical protein [Gemmataceae bacterium]